MTWLYISAQKLESERSKSFALSIKLKTRTSAPSLASKGLENIPQVPGNPPEVCQNHDVRLGYFFSLKVKWGYISVQKLESERSKSFAVCISLQTKAIKS